MKSKVAVFCETGREIWSS